MNNSKENNSFNCYLSNTKSYSQLVESNNESENTFQTRRKLVVEINSLKKSLSDLQIEKEDLNIQLLQQFKELKRSQKNLNKDLHKGLSEMMFILSHKVRLPLTNILGLANLLTNVENSNDENLAYIELIKVSAKDLDRITKELGSFIYELNHKK
jgi:signal transduction histidine kinase